MSTEEVSMTNRYEEASDAARKLLENFDEIDLAEMLASRNASAPPAGAPHVSNALKEDCQRFRGMVLAEVWERLRDVDGGPMIDAMRVVTDMQEGR